MKKYIIALDQGTTTSRAILFDKNLSIVEVVSKEFRQIYPNPGWVEHDPLEIYASLYAVMMEAIAKSGIDPNEIDSIGISNQRETTIVWDKRTGKPVYNAICWQCRRTSSEVEALKEKGLEPYIRENTGLVLDAYFSLTKVKWILDNVDGCKEEANKGNLLFGTVDTWLIWKLTNGLVHKTDYTNASRTMMFNINTLKWDSFLLEQAGIPLSMLPEVSDSSGFFGTISIFGEEVPITGVMGDQQAALFGQTCFEAGEIKNTYGTGCFLLMNTGSKKVISKNGLVTTIASSIHGVTQYALEGSIFVGGALIQWLRDEMHFVLDACDTEYFAQKVKDNGGIYVVPAFTGLGAPYWDMYARGTIFGITRGTNRNHIIRACCEAICYETWDVIESMNRDTQIPISHIRVDGGASRNNFIMQFQSSIASCNVIRPSIMESTSLGACFLAGLYTGFFQSKEEIKNKMHLDQTFYPKMSEEERNHYLKNWRKAVKMSLGWDKD